MTEDDTVQTEKSLSLALLGHDLRAALAEMRSGLYLIHTADLPVEVRAMLDRCRAVGDTLDRLIDQSVLVCLGQASPAANTPVMVNTTAFLDALRERWTGQSADRGHRFNLIAAGDMPDTFNIDRTALDRVLANLIGNAICHTPPGPITVTFKISGGDLFLISVEDQGPGFPAAHLDAIQQDFSLPPDARRAGGGFGLQSVKLLVGAMGGRCNARNKASGGAEVGICLPIRASEKALAPEASLSLAQPPDLTGTRLLLADDSASARELLGALAHNIGATLTAVKDGSQAIAALDAGPLPDVLILDDEMPGATGLDVLRWLRGRAGALGRLPVLALTSHIGVEEVAALHMAGATVVLAKPVLCPLELGRAIRRAQGFDDGQAMAQPPPATADLSALRHLGRLAGPEAAAELFQKLEEDLTTARTGLATAAQTGNLAAIRAHSHVIIALAGTAGAMSLHGDAVTLNGMAHDHQPVERIVALGKALDAKLAALLDMVQTATQPAPNGTAPS